MIIDLTDSEDAGALSAEAGYHPPRKSSLPKQFERDVMQNQSEDIQQYSEVLRKLINQREPEQVNLDSSRSGQPQILLQLKRSFVRPMMETFESQALASKETIQKIVAWVQEPGLPITLPILAIILNKTILSVQNENWTEDEVDKIRALVTKHMKNEGLSKLERNNYYVVYTRFLLKCATSSQNPNPKKQKWIEEAHVLLGNLMYFEEIKPTTMYARAAILLARISPQEDGDRILNVAIERISKCWTNGDGHLLLALLKLEKIMRFWYDMDANDPKNKASAKSVYTNLANQMEDVKTHAQKSIPGKYFDARMHRALFDYRWVMKESSLIPRKEAIPKQKLVLRQVREDLRPYLSAEFPLLVLQADMDEWWNDCFVMITDIANLSLQLHEEDKEEYDNIKKTLHPQLLDLLGLPH